MPHNFTAYDVEYTVVEQRTVKETVWFEPTVENLKEFYDPETEIKDIKILSGSPETMPTTEEVINGGTQELDSGESEDLKDPDEVGSIPTDVEVEAEMPEYVTEEYTNENEIRSRVD